MGKYDKRISDTALRLGEVTFAFAHVLYPRREEDGTAGKYSVCVLIPKSDVSAINMIQQAVAAAQEKGRMTKWGGKIPARMNLPLHDGDADDKGPEFAGMMYFNCSTKNKPGVRVLENGHISEALDDDDFYSGCWGAVTVNMYPYANSGNNGIAVGLNNVIKTRDAERLSGGSSADADFADMADVLN